MEHLFPLKQSYLIYQFIQQQMTATDEEMAIVLHYLVAETEDGIITQLGTINTDKEF